MRRLWLAAVVVAVPAMCAGCGSSPPSAADPAAAVPSGVPFYLEAVVRPASPEQHALAVVGARVLGNPKPLARLQRLLSFGGHRPRAGSFDRLIGRKVGLFFAAAQPLEERSATPSQLLALIREASRGNLFANPRTPPGAEVFDVGEVAALRAFLRSAAGKAAHAVSFLGSRLTVLADGEAAALVGHYLVIGNLLGVERSVEALKNGHSLRQNQAFAKLRATAPGGPLAAYLALPKVAAPSPTDRKLGLPPYLERLIGPPGTAAYLALSLSPSEVRLELDRYPAAADPPTAQETETAAATAQLFAGLPEAAWLAVAFENLPDAVHKAELAYPLVAPTLSLPLPATVTLAGLLGALGEGFGGALSALTGPLQGVVKALTSHPSALASALRSWLGPAALFIGGSSLVELNGGVVVASRNEAAAKGAVGSFGKILSESSYAVRPDRQSPVATAIAVSLPGLPGGLQIAAGNGKFVAGLGADPLQAAFSPQGTLGAASTFRQATSSLGEGLSPRLYLAFPQLTAVLGLLGANSNPSLTPILQRLYALSTLTVGVGRSGPLLRTVAVFELSP